MSTSEPHLPVVPETERLMVEMTEAVLREREIEYALEVPLLFFYIDLVFRDGEGELVAVEFKLHDWRRGIAQAKGHELGASRMYVCLPAPRVTEKCREAAREAGVGVLAWSPAEPLYEDVPALRSNILVDVVQDWLEDSFMRRVVHV
ncbi:MAG: hypothetical protein OXU74_10080 [Gemmatimonadota bacterium]|nr:hypothetical protein [Gemmatimonadota bacterium]